MNNFLKETICMKSLYIFFIYFSLILLVFPNSLLITPSFEIYINSYSNWKWINSLKDLISIPFAIFLIIPLIIIYFNNKNFFFNKLFNFNFTILVYLILFFLLSYFYSEQFNFRVLKNIFIILFLLSFFLFLIILDFKNYLNFFKFYTLAISIICLGNMFNMNFFYVSSSDNIWTDTYLSGFFQLRITNYQDYFPFVIFLSLALDFFFFKKAKIIALTAIMIKLIWFLQFNYFSFFLYGKELNTSILIVIFCFIILFIIFKIFELKLNQKFILYSIIYVNLFYLIIEICFFKYLHLSLKDRAENFFFIFSNMNFFDMLYPVIHRNEFMHNLHNDFWDLYFTFGIFFIFIYCLFSKLIFKLYSINKYSALVFYSTFVIGSLVQNNIFNLYLSLNSIVVFFMIYKYSKNY